MGEVTLSGIRSQPLELDEVVAAVTHRAAGGVVTFTGVVRDHDGGRAVARLAYTAHPSAADTLARVAADVAAEHEVVAVAVLHRVGALEIGDAAVVMAVSAAHRGAAFVACSRLIDDLKARVPIWKEQTFGDGSTEWVGTP